MTEPIAQGLAVAHTPQVDWQVYPLSSKLGQVEFSSCLSAAEQMFFFGVPVAHIVLWQNVCLRLLRRKADRMNFTAPRRRRSLVDLNIEKPTRTLELDHAHSKGAPA